MKRKKILKIIILLAVLACIAAVLIIALVPVNISKRFGLQSKHAEYLIHPVNSNAQTTGDRCDEIVRLINDLEGTPVIWSVSRTNSVPERMVKIYYEDETTSSWYFWGDHCSVRTDGDWKDYRIRNYEELYQYLGIELW